MPALTTLTARTASPTIASPAANVLSLRQRRSRYVINVTDERSDVAVDQSSEVPTMGPPQEPTGPPRAPKMRAALGSLLSKTVALFLERGAWSTHARARKHARTQTRTHAEHAPTHPRTYAPTHPRTHAQAASVRDVDDD